MRKFGLVAGMLSLSSAANAFPVSVGVGKLPFGPFTTSETIIVNGHIANDSANVIYLCPGTSLNCATGTANSFSVGATLPSLRITSLSGATALIQPIRSDCQAC
jgi:hypothetical protein